MVALVVFAKVPIVGHSKTRIARETSLETALQIYKELLVATSHLLLGGHYHVTYTGNTSSKSLQEYFPHAQTFFMQQGTTLGEIEKNAFVHLFKCGYTAVIGIGCDCPTQNKNDHDAALAALENNTDVVIGPALDGGYYLIGCKPTSLAVFDAQQWSTPFLFDETLDIIKNNNFTFKLLPKKSDIDTIDDYNAWKQAEKK
jgi:rSAM/selenodomain-associated transferase 1